MRRRPARGVEERRGAPASPAEASATVQKLWGNGPEASATPETGVIFMFREAGSRRPSGWIPKTSRFSRC
jgi:hypothetical protein